jgi:hypothetical protein
MISLSMYDVGQNFAKIFSLLLRPYVQQMGPKWGPKWDNLSQLRPNLLNGANIGQKVKKGHRSHKEWPKGVNGY